MIVLDDLVERGFISEDQRNQMLKDIEVKAGTVTGTTPEDLMRDPRTPSQQGRAYQQRLDSYNQSSNVQELITSVVPRVQDLPQAVGITGRIGIAGAGALTALGQDEMAEVFSEMVAGADPETISALNTQLQVIRTEVIPLVTGEESTRISDKERELASRAVALIDSVDSFADLTKAYPQVMGALKQLYEESWANKYRIASQDAKFEYPYDLSSEDERTELIQEFLDAQIDEQSIRRAVTRFMAIQGVNND
jgi:hypothetical protein